MKIGGAMPKKNAMTTIKEFKLSKPISLKKKKKIIRSKSVTISTQTEDANVAFGSFAEQASQGFLMLSPTSLAPPNERSFREAGVQYANTDLPIIPRATNINFDEKASRRFRRLGDEFEAASK